MKKKAVCIILFYALFHVLFSQTDDFKTLAFFSAVSNSKESNTINLIQDLYFSHVSVLEQYTVIDYRNTQYTNPLPSNIQEPSTAFFVIINENAGKWKCSFHAVIFPELKEYSKEFIYDSYYQILLDAKNVVALFFTSLSTGATLDTVVQNPELETPKLVINLDSIAGTWAGDEFIDKIVILRAGRGFIIYKNGATMNISVQVSNNKIIAKQTSKANASFFPELPREFALTAAPETDPLEWVMEAVNENLMIGEKKTIEAVYDNGIPVSVKKITVSAKWTR